MKVLWILLLASTFAGQGQVIAQRRVTDASENRPPNFTLSIKAPQRIVKMNQKPIVMVTMKNISTEDLHPVLMFGWTVLDSAGKPVPEIKNNEPGFVAYGSYPSILLKPGASSTGPADLSKLFAISKPGKYTIQVWREYYEPQSNRVLGKVKSNTIAIKIIE